MAKPPRAILFDLDDTILSAYAQRGNAWLTVADRFATDLAPLPAAEAADEIDNFATSFWADADRHRRGRLNTLAARREIVAGAFGMLARRGRPTPAAAVADRLADAFSEYRDRQMHLFPDAHRVLDTLRVRGIRLGLVTNGERAVQRAKIERFDLARRFDHVQIEEEHGFGKPEERAYTHALGALGVAPEATWMVGDHLEWDVAAPQRLGIFAIWYDPDGDGLPRGSAIQPDRIIRTLAELLS